MKFCGIQLRAISHEKLQIPILDISLGMTNLRLQSHHRSVKWVGVGGFLSCWQPSAMWVGPFIFFYGHHRGCLNNPISSNLGLCAACWAHFMCHYELWPTSASPFSFLNSSLGLAGGKHYQKITILSLDLFFKILLFQVAFFIFFFIAIFSPYFLLVGLSLQYVTPFQSRELVKYQRNCKLM